MVQAPLTRAAWVDQQLRESILSGDLAPGERLMAAPLAEKFTVSPTPLREALWRLAAEGLVEITPQRGARVSVLSQRDGLELLELRRVLEPLAVQRSVRAGPTESLFSSALEAQHNLDNLLRAPYSEALSLVRANRRLHDAVMSAADQDQLLRVVFALADQTTRYHVLAIQTWGPSGLLLEASSHELPQLILNQDEDSLTKIFLQHLGLLEDAVTRLGEGGYLAQAEKKSTTDGENHV